MPSRLLWLALLLAACGEKDPIDSDPQETDDADGDGYPLAVDCDDTDPAVNPGADELPYDGSDNDCDADTPDDDLDEDGATRDTDCDDTDPAMHPGAEELPYDGLDNDCDPGTPDDDLDGDGAAFDTDCDDSNSAVYPGAEELPYDGLDNDCDPGTSDGDLDGDGVPFEDDCDDTDPAVYPGAPETCGDGVVNDCDMAPADALADCASSGSLSGADAIWLGEAAGDEGGGVVAAAGDVNRDGLQDLLISSTRHGGTGAAYVVFGGALGTHTLSIADATFTGEAKDDVTGLGLAGAGDVNQDGYDDILIGAQWNDRGARDAGSAYLVLGPVAGSTNLENADAIFTGEASNDMAGRVLAGAGDVNGDSFSDLLIAAIEHDHLGLGNVGAIYLIHGPVTGTMSLSDAEARLLGEAEYDYAGVSVASAGDTDGDGLSELLIGAYGQDDGGAGAGMAYVVLGALSGDVSLADAEARLSGEKADDNAGYAVAGVGDTNGDGFDDMLIGAKGVSAGAGGAYLVLGPVSGDRGLSSADATLLGEKSGDNAGRTASGAGDVDGDGLPDLVVGAYNNDGGGTDAGAAYVLSGLVSGSVSLSASTLKFTGEAAYDEAGHTVVGLGDSDGDGFDDLLISAPKADEGGADAGAAYLILGGGI